MAELVLESRLDGSPIELGSSLSRIGGLIEQQDLGEIVAQACAGLLIGTWDCSRGADCRRSGIGQRGDRPVQSIPDDVAAASGVVLQDAPEEVRQVGYVNRRPVLAPRAEDDQIAVVVSR